MKLIQLDMNTMKSEQDVYEFLEKQMEISGCEAGDLDTVFDYVLSNLQYDCCVELVRCGADSALAGFSNNLEKLLEEAARTVEEKDGKLYAVLEGTDTRDSGAGWQGISSFL